MGKGKFPNIHNIVDKLIEESIKKDWICVDATLGNGNDALKIIKKIDIQGHLYGFDIQKSAIDNTKNLLQSHGYLEDNVTLICDGHENASSYINKKIDFFIMNLGYLPRGNKNITTTSNSTIEFLHYILTVLKTGSIGIVVFYPGHTQGREELEKVNEYLSNLDQKCYNVMECKFLNQMNEPPQLTLIERI